MHDPRDMPRPADAGPGKPAFMEAVRTLAELDRLDDDDWATIIATYYGMVSRLDDQLGRLVRALEQAGVAERTVTFFHTDHGEYLGDYGMVEKWPSGLDDCLLRNPLIVAGPGVAAGEVAESFVEMIDLPATLCEFADVELGHHHFGRSLVPVLADPTLHHRERAFSEGGFRIEEADLNERPDHFPYLLKGRLQQDRPDLVGRAVAARTPRWTYVYRLYEADELYDRETDPHETTNVAHHDEHAGTVHARRDDVLSWLVETSDIIRAQRDPRMEQPLFDQLLGTTRSAYQPPG
jgi:arylsulfatase A-like enzyme